tara:strand:+ start:414 stop:956 length:543 start_codon:yes stop_codon:yes gene_type:complete
MNKFVFFFCLNFLFSDSDYCIDKFYNYNKVFLKSNLLYLKVNIDNNPQDSLYVFIDKKKRYKITFNDKVIYADSDKIINYSPISKQLFIDKPDTLLNDFIFSISDTLFFKNITQNKYFNYNDIKIFYNNECNKIDSVLMKNFNQLMRFNNIEIDTLKIKDSNSIFDLNIDESKVFKYDFR